jgi:subtilase family serine protease
MVLSSAKQICPRFYRRKFMSKGACLSGLAGLAAVLVFATANMNASPRTPVGSDAGLQTPTHPLIMGSIDETNLVRLVGNTRPEANAKNDRGLLPDSYRLDHMFLLLQRSPEREQALVELIGQLHDKNSPSFHKWLGASEFGERFGLGQEDIATVTAWLKSHGFTVNFVYANRMQMDFSGTAGQVREAFHTEMHNLNVDGVAHISNMSDPQIPRALAPAVQGVVSLNNFRPRAMKMKKKNGQLGVVNLTEFTFGPDCGFLTSLRDGTTNCEALMPPDLATIYNLNPLFAAGITGLGQTIVVVEDEDAYSLGDWNFFRKASGLARAYPHGSITQTHPPSSPVNNCVDPGDLNDTTDDEVAIDMEWASAAAPNAAIQVAVCDDSGVIFGGLIAIQNILNAAGPYPGTISMSYGESEATTGATQNANFNTTFQQAVTQGVSVFVSSGDEGPCSGNANGSDCTRGITVSGWTSSPYDISVGGTDFGDAYAGTETTYWNPTNDPNYGSAKSYIPEIPWNDSCADTLTINFLNAYYSANLVNGYGSSGTGVCNTYPWNTTADLLTTGSGSGGPSNCATGSPTTSGIPASGGTCAGYAKPSYQVGILGNPSDGVRDIPDVSLMAANGVWNHFYLICMSNPAEISEGYAVPCNEPVEDWPGFGGTSVSSPIWAGIQALVNQYTGQHWGNANTMYYQIANTEYGLSGNANCNSSLGNAVGVNCTFYDVTQGSIILPCTTTGSGTAARLYNCYRTATTDATADIGVTSAAPMTFPGAGGPGPVTALNITNSNGGTTSYTSAPTCALTGGAGAGATCTTSISGLVTALTKTASGSGYATAPLCSVTGGGGLGATCSVTLTGSAVNVITLKSGGSGFTSTPTCTLSGGGGSGATCTATIHTGVTGITLTAGGSGYTSDPTCALTGGGGSPAATCTSVINGVTSLTPQAYPTQVGWDFATGIGTVNAYNLVMNPAW